MICTNVSGQPETGRSFGDSRVGELSAPVFPKSRRRRNYRAAPKARRRRLVPTDSPSGISVVIVRLSDAEPRVRASKNIDRRDAPAQAVVVTVPQIVEREEGTVRVGYEPDLRADSPEIGRGELLFEFGDE